MHCRKIDPKRLLGALALTAALAVGGAAQAGADQKNPYKQPDGTWISISGTVKSVQPNNFTLDYGKGMITVQMDDVDRDANAYKLAAGDKVTVNGMIDDDLFETTTIDASSVYVEKLGTYFYASPADEEDVYFYTIETPIVVSDTVVRGVVTEVDDDEFVIDTGRRKLRVEVDEMPYNPLDDEGYQKIRSGDYVRVTGQMDDHFFTGRELVADSVVKLAS
ncbi:MAG: hypothetical protein R3F35_12685 [Myxococcota bacterium]